MELPCLVHRPQGRRPSLPPRRLNWLNSIATFVPPINCFGLHVDTFEVSQVICL